jgi:hypothetical protein
LEFELLPKKKVVPFLIIYPLAKFENFEDHEDLFFYFSNGGNTQYLEKN